MITDERVDEGDMGRGSGGRDGKGEKTLCKAMEVERDDKGNGSGGREGKEDSALDTASS